MQQKPIVIDVAPDPVAGQEPASFSDGTERKITVGELQVQAAADTGYVSVPVRNVGAGLAVLAGAGLACPQEGKPDPLPVSGALFDRRNIPPGERTRVNFQLSRWHVGWSAFEYSVNERGDFAVEISYRDLAGKFTMTRFDLRRRQKPGAPWEIADIHVMDCAERAGKLGSGRGVEALE